MKASAANFKFKNSSESVDILIYDNIGEYIDWVNWTIAGVTYKSFSDEFEKAIASNKRINIRLNTSGGDIHAGIAIYNLIERYPSNDIHIYVDSVAYSMGAIILQAVPVGKRHAAKNSMIMVHSASLEMSGLYDASSLREVAEVLDKYNQILSQSIADKVGLSVEEVLSKYFDGKDHFLTANEALEAGLIDDIQNDVIENGVEKIVNKIIDKTKNLFTNKKTEIMDLQSVRNKLASGVITPADCVEMMQVIDQFNNAKFTNEEVATAVIEATAPLEDTIAKQENEIQNLKEQVNAANLGGGIPADAIDTDPNPPVDTASTYRPQSFWKPKY